MFRRYSPNFAVVSILVDMLSTIIALYMAGIWRASINSPFIPLNRPHIIPFWMWFAIPFIWTCVFVFCSVYDPEKTYRIINEIQVLCVAVFISALVLAGLLYLTSRDLSRGLYLSFVLIDVSMLFAWRFLLRICTRMGVPSIARRNVVIIGAGEVGQKVAEMISQYGSDRLNLVGFLDDFEVNVDDIELLGQTLEVDRVVERNKVDDVIIALPLSAYMRSNEIILALQSKPVNIRVIPDYFNLALYRANFASFGSIPMINLRDPALNDVQRMIKRGLDILISIVIIILVLPIMCIVALITKLDSSGGIIFKQDRVGENGKIFKMLKFRTMVANAEQQQSQVNIVNEEGHLIHKHRKDPRVTRFGRILRRSSLDELPQLFNVLIGDMSLVGPRPEMPWLVNKYEPWQHTRFAVPQGITGWWQVHGRSDKPLHMNSSDDLYYVQNYSIWMDLYILLRTPLVVIKGKGAF